MRNPVIKQIKVNSKFKYLWLKYIYGVNLNLHCARCLLGAYCKDINIETESISNIKLDEYPAKAYYLCGVAKPTRWENNFHLAFIYKKGSTIEIDEHGIYVKIKDAKRIDIAQVDIEKSPNPHKYDKKYNTCRNWWFAHQFIDMFGDDKTKPIEYEKDK